MKTIALFSTDIRSEHDVMRTRQRVRQIAGLLGFEMQDQTRIATAVSEVARNAVQHAGGGKVEFQVTGDRPQLLQIRIRDTGPGIPNLEELMHPPCPSSSALGTSLRGVCRLMDVCHIDSSPKTGTLVTLGKYRPRPLPPVETADIARITQDLMQRASEDPLAEMQRQNQELLHTLEELRLQEEERVEHIKEIKLLNARLKRSVSATHHRVKNNLQIISALVEIQIEAGDLNVPVSALLRIGQHARALATLHDLLTHETQIDAETEQISTRAALNKLLPSLEAITGGRQIRYEVDDFNLSVGQSASLALLISELVSNALKHGINDINLKLAILDNHATLEVSNDGNGFPPDFDWRTAANTGLNLIDSTGRHDLHGTISYENRPEGGACVRVIFPVSGHPIPIATS